MHTDTRTIDVPRLVVGTLLAAAGLLLTLARFDLVDAPRRLFAYWPLLVVGLGVGALLHAGSHRGQREALWLIGVGGWMLVSSLSLFGLHWGDSWPLLLLVAGAVQLARPKDGSWRGDGVWTLFLGAFLLVAVNGFFGLRLDELWPLLLVLVGAMIVARALLAPHRGVG